MKQRKLEMLALLTMVLAFGLAVIIALLGGGYWAFLPMIAWFVWGQIVIVPKLMRKKRNREKGSETHDRT